jgi:hypothetical protein
MSENSTESNDMDSKKALDTYGEFRKISVLLFQITYMFLILFNIIYFIGIPIKALILKVNEPWAAIFDILQGIGVVVFLIYFYMCAHTRMGSFVTLIGFAYWWMVPSNWIIMEWDDMQWDFALTYYIIWTIFVLLAIVAGIGLLNFFSETIRMKKENKSVLLGPWGSTFAEVLSVAHLTPLQKQKMKKGLGITLLVIGLSAPGLLSFGNVYEFPIEVTPQNYDITYNFWATPNINGTYKQEWVDKYHFTPQYYNDSILDEFNKHKVNLDLTFNRLTYSDVAMLKAWEARCPDITYRITIYPSQLSEVPELVENATEIMIECIQNNTLDQWLGFCFDIEGPNFRYNSSYKTFDEATAMWNGIFDYVEAKAKIINQTIEMECVSDPWVAMDIKFDGDADIHKFRAYNEYYPERFTTYAPMIYRCWYEGQEPWGSPEDPADKWDTSFSVYSTLYNLKSGIPDEKLGFYIGITNTSCYGRDLPQPEPYDWPKGVPNSGYANLLRDVLIAKHFGMKEITFFLAWSWIEGGHSMGGVFESYGINFLDVVNQTVNTNPPKSFNVYYSQADAKNCAIHRSDWLYDFSRVEGVLQVIGFWIGAIVLTILLNKRRNT